MRTLFVAAIALALSACATQEAAKSAAAPAPATTTVAAPAAKAPQCYSGDHGKFFNIGDKATISGVNVTCEKTSDGKNGQWMGAKKH
jgi:hypothetical protein